MTVMDPLSNIFTNSCTKSCEQFRQCFIELERYVNDGSPSGFNKGVDFEYHPFNSKKYFDLPVYQSERLNHVQVGQLPAFWTEKFSIEDKIPIPIHPEVLDIILSSCPNLASEKKMSIKVQPTSSGRTVLWENTDQAHYIKLHFPKKIGRFHRDLSIHKWLSCLEKSKEFYLYCNSFPSIMGFLYDFGGIFYIDKKTGSGFGTIFREFKPRPKISITSKLLLPAFSLFAKSNKKGRENKLLHYILDLIGNDKYVFFSLFINPLIESFLYLSLEIGLIPECNAQNVLYEFDLEKLKTRIIFRDLGDTFVDHEVRRSKKLHTMFCTYKSLDGIFGKDIFQRRSFAYDFKLSFYILKPLIDRYVDITRKSAESLYLDIKDVFHSKFNYSKYYFDSNTYWYSYPNEDNVGRDSYIKNRNPIFR